MDLNPKSFDGPSFGPVFWHPPLSAGGGGVVPPTTFSKQGGAWQDLNFQRGLAGKERGDFFQRVQFFFIEIKLKSEIFNNKNNLLTKMFCSMCSIITKNLINFKRWFHIPKWLISQCTLWLVPLKPSLCHNTRDIYFTRLLDY